jgi:hypothetical protein
MGTSSDGSSPGDEYVGAFVGANLLGEILGGDVVVAAESHGMLDAVLKLTHISGPCVCYELLRGGRGHADDVLLLSFGGLGDKVLREGEDVPAACTQRGELEANDVEAEERGLRESVALRWRFEIAVGRRDDRTSTGTSFVPPSGRTTLS